MEHAHTTLRETLQTPSVCISHLVRLALMLTQQSFNNSNKLHHAARLCLHASPPTIAGPIRTHHTNYTMAVAVTPSPLASSHDKHSA